LFTALVALAACGQEDPAPIASERFEDLVTARRTIHLEESESVVNVSPVVEIDPLGGFLVADAGAEAQVRRYAVDGRLLWHVGRKGGGPGEFEALAMAVRLRSGEILAADRGGQLTVFDSAGAALNRTIQTGLAHVEDVVVLNESILLLSGIAGASAGPRLHLWNLHRGQMVKSFFAPFANSPNPSASTSAGWSRASVRGDTVAAVFATSDTVYFFTTAGQPLGQRPLPSRYFRRVTAEGPRNRSDIAWMGTFDLVSDVHWLADGTLLVPYLSLVFDQDPMKPQRKWHLLRMTRSGEPIFEIPDIPKLLQTDPRRDEIYFVDPAAEAANQWVVARIRHDD
jgi:hypothetical protein